MFFLISVWLRYTVEMDGLISSKKWCAAGLSPTGTKLGKWQALYPSRLFCPLYILILGTFINLKFRWFFLKYVNPLNTWSIWLIKSNFNFALDKMPDNLKQETSLKAYQGQQL